MKHEMFEKNSILLLVGILVMVSIGGIVQIAPLFWVESTIEKVKGMRPYTPLEQAGRDIYLREGCYGCHSQMIRTLRDEVERYGHYSLAAESMYDHPFQWGSKRTGPDLARVGGKYSDQWQAEHMMNPRSVVPESIMPGYPWLADRKLDTHDIAAEAQDAEARRRPLQRRDDREGRAGCCRADQSRQPAGARAAASAIPRPRSRNSTASPAPSPPSSMRSSPTCRCWARWSTSPPSMPPAPTCAEKGCHHDL